MLDDILNKLNNNPELITINDLKELTNEEIDIIENLSNNLAKKNSNKELSKKKQINTLYGALANSYFPLYDIRLADSTTSFGRLYIKSIGDRVNNYLISNYDYSDNNALIYTHTDSTYFDMKPVVDKEIEIYKKDNKDYIDLLLDKSNSLMKIIEGQFLFCSKICNSKDNSVLKMELESISDVGIWSKSSNYFIRNHYKKQRLHKPKIKIVGMEIIKSSTSTFSKNIFKNNLDLFLDENNFNILNFINGQYEIFEKEKIENISFNKKINNINKYVINDINKLPIIDEIINFKKNIFKKNIFEELDDNIDVSKYDIYDINKLNIINLLDNIDIHISLNNIDIDLINNYIKDLEEFISILNLEDKFNLFKENLFNQIKIYINKIKNDMFYEVNNDFIIKKGTNNYIVAAIKFNQYIKENDLENIFNPIYSGDRIKYIYLKRNNPFNSEVIGFKDLKFIKYIKNWIDFKLQFEKSFINPLSQITNVLNLDTSFKNRELNKFKDSEYYDIFN